MCEMCESWCVAPNPLGQVRVREENDGTVGIYVKIGQNRWAVSYVNPNTTEAGIEGHVSDPIATRWPVVYQPKQLGGNLK